MNRRSENFGAWLRRRFASPLLALLRQGLEPDRLAACLTLGLLLGVFPVLGTTTLLCAAVAVAFKLNVATMQAVNYVAYPLQIGLLAPLMQAGGYLFGRHGQAVSPRMLSLLIHGGWMHAFHLLAWLTLQAVAAWLLLAPPAAAAFYLLLRSLLRRIAPQRAQVKEAT